MPNWTGGILTTRGAALQAKVDAGQTTLTFTKMKIGSGVLSGGQTLEALNDLITPKQNVGISGITANGNITTLTGVITNAGLAAGYQVRELGVYAQDPTLGEILYSVTVDSAPDYLPPEGGAVAVSQEFNYHIAVSNATNVTATLSTSGLVTVGMLQSHNHDGTGNNGPKLGSAALLDGAVTDLAIGNRTIVDTTAATSGAGTITNLLSKLGYMIKAITGKANWYTLPIKTIEQLNSEKAPIANPVFTGSVTLPGDPGAAMQAATKQYVDSVASGLDFKAPVRVATTGNITLSGLQLIDGITVVVNDRVLVKNQTTASQNGIYIAASGGWTRSTDCDATVEVNGGMWTFVDEGTTQADTSWVLTTNNPITLGTTALTFAQFDGARNITAGSGLTKTGNTFSVAADGITAAMIAPGAVDDTATGTRTITDTTAAAATADTPTNLFSKLGYMIKAITGKANWYTLPAITLEALNTLIVSAATAGKLLKLDASGLLPTGITGNAATATKLATARTISLTGDVTGSASFDGSGNATIATTVMAAMPVGFTFSILANTPPAGCLRIDQGSLVTRAAYPDLWTWVQANAPLITEAAWQAQAAVQSSVGAYSSGDGSTTFRLPRIVDFVRGSTTGRDPGTWQDDDLESHVHNLTGATGTGGNLIVFTASGTAGNTVTAMNNQTSATGGTETRPKSVAMLYCVKAFGASANQGTIDITELANSITGKLNVADIGTLLFGARVWTSSEYTPALGTPTISTHNLGLDPLKARGEVLLKCTTAEFGYSIGDYAINPSFVQQSNGDTPIVPALAANEIRVTTGNVGTGVTVTRKDNNTMTQITLANWRYIFRVWY